MREPHWLEQTDGFRAQLVKDYKILDDHYKNCRAALGEMYAAFSKPSDRDTRTDALREAEFALGMEPQMSVNPKVERK